MKKKEAQKVTIYTLFAQVVAELVEEFTKRFGSHVQVLDWALHMDEATPHIHERHVFFDDDGYGMSFPKQEKACEALAFERPNPEKKSNKFNNAKMVFDEEVRKLYIEIAEKYGVVIDKIPLEGKRYYCFGCGAHGDAIDFVANLYGIGMKEAAIKIATDLHISYDDKLLPAFCII